MAVNKQQLNQNQPTLGFHKVLFEHSHVHSFTFHLCLLLYYGGVEKLQLRSSDLQNWKYLLFGTLHNLEYKCSEGRNCALLIFLSSLLSQKHNKYLLNQLIDESVFGEELQSPNFVFFCFGDKPCWLTSWWWINSFHSSIHPFHDYLLSICYVSDTILGFETNGE